MSGNNNGTWRDDNLTGTSASDTLSGASGNDTIDGGDGDDSLTGDSGQDSIDGGDGHDTLSGGAQADTLTGGAGDDCLTGGSQQDELYGGTGDDTLDGGSQEDFLDGGAGNDGLSGGSQTDTLLGGLGDDTLDGGSCNDQVFGGAGDDVVDGSYGSDLVGGGTGNDTLEMGDYDGGRDTLVFQPGDGADLASGWSPTSDFIHIGDMDPDDVVFTPTDDPQIWVMTFDGVPDDSLTLDFTYYWDTSIDEADLRARIMTTDDMQLPDHATDAVICFTAGTLIETPGGPRAIETLQSGELVTTLDQGAQHTQAVLRTRITPAQMAAAPNLCPVQITAGAFGPGRPRRDMMVSRQHAFLALNPRGTMSEHLVRAVHIAEELDRARLSAPLGADLIYYHLLMRTGHHLVRADGVWTETVFPGPQAQRAAPLLPRIVSTDQSDLRATARVRPLLRRSEVARLHDLRLGVSRTQGVHAARLRQRVGLSDPA